MESGKRSPVVGVLGSRPQLNRALAELRRTGFGDAQVDVVAPGWAPSKGLFTGQRRPGECAEAFAGRKTVAGLLPRVGPVLACGTVTTLLRTVPKGTTPLGLAEHLRQRGVPEPDLSASERALQSGHILVIIDAGGRWPEAVAAFRLGGAVTGL